MLFPIVLGEADDLLLVVAQQFGDAEDLPPMEPNVLVHAIEPLVGLTVQVLEQLPLPGVPLQVKEVDLCIRPPQHPPTIDDMLVHLRHELEVASVADPCRHHHGLEPVALQLLHVRDRHVERLLIRKWAPC